MPVDPFDNPGVYLSPNWDPSSWVSSWFSFWTVQNRRVPPVFSTHPGFCILRESRYSLFWAWPVVRPARCFAGRRPKQGPAKPRRRGHIFPLRHSVAHFSCSLEKFTRSSSALSHPSLGEGSPAKIDYREKGYSCSNLSAGPSFNPCWVAQRPKDTRRKG